MFLTTAVVSLRGRLLGRCPELDLGEHINHFVPGTLDRLLIRAGFAPDKRFSGCTRAWNQCAIAPGFRATVRWLASSAVMLGHLSQSANVCSHDDGISGRQSRNPSFRFFALSGSILLTGWNHAIKLIAVTRGRTSPRFDADPKNRQPNDPSVAKRRIEIGQMRQCGPRRGRVVGKCAENAMPAFGGLQTNFSPGSSSRP